jgi:peptidoglycan L-alanyl-D-glutamate endopeptidase CwlK
VNGIQIKLPWPQIKNMTLKDRWKRIQKKVGAKPDGRAGPQTVGMIEKALNIGALAASGKFPTGVLDARSADNIATLNPKVHPMFSEITLEGKRIAKRLGASDYKMISGARTFAQQDKLYAKGRTAGGPRVTNARGGYSVHNFGIAGDFGVFGTGGSYLDSSDPKLATEVHKAVAKWAKVRFKGEVEWGGDWKSFVDYPHFQFNNGMSLSQMRAKVAAGRAIV